MPVFYKHWQFGKHFAHHEAFYRKGIVGLGYEIVIKRSPCISYLMEENTATMQTLVIAHAAFGHNHFFKNSYLFKQWTDAEGILDYLDFEELRGAMRGAPRPAGGRADARCGACPDAAWDRSLSRQQEAQSSHRRKARPRAPPARGECGHGPIRTLPPRPATSAAPLH